MSTRTEDTEINKRQFIAPAVLAGVIVGLWLLTPFLVQVFFDKLDERGQFGDLFGSVNALFSGLAFAGLIFAILLQRQELALQRQELILQREEMKASRKQLTAQAKAADALFHATVGQIRVSAMQALVEAKKQRSIVGSATQLDKRAIEIEEIAQTMMESADALESVFGGGQPLAEVDSAGDQEDAVN